MKKTPNDNAHRSIFNCIYILVRFFINMAIKVKFLKQVLVKYLTVGMRIFIKIGRV